MLAALFPRWKLLAGLEAVPGAITLGAALVLAWSGLILWLA